MAIKGEPILKLENIGGKDAKFVPIEQVTQGVDLFWQEHQRQTVWYYPFFNLLFYKTNEFLVTLLDDGNDHVIELPNSLVIPEKLVFIGEL